MQEKRATHREAQDLRLLEQLETAARSLGFTVRVERGSFRSGRCRSRDEELIILNRRLGSFDRAQALARILAAADLDRAFLLPAVREQIQTLAGPRHAGGDPTPEAEATGGGAR